MYVASMSNGAQIIYSKIESIHFGRPSFGPSGFAILNLSPYNAILMTNVSSVVFCTKRFDYAFIFLPRYH